MDASLDRPEDEWTSDRAAVARPFLRDMEQLWREVLKMAAIVESSLRVAVEALLSLRSDPVKSSRETEVSINELDVQIESDCLKILALHQPVASDLRRVTSILRIDRDLERIADITEHICSRTRKLVRLSPPLPVPKSLEAMANEVLKQVRFCLDALIHSDADLARSVINRDRRIDNLRQSIIRELKELIRQDPERLDSWLRLVNTARNLERISDHTTNIAESVIYMTEGVIVRHTGRTRGDS